MIMIEWDRHALRKLKRKERLARDRRIVLLILWMMPLMSAKDMARITGFSENRCYKLLGDLSAEDLVVQESMGRGMGTRLRYWLTTKGVRRVAAETKSPIPWQVTESGVGWLIRRLPMVEQFYALVPKLMSHEGVIIEEAGHIEPDGGLSRLGFAPTLRMVEFGWMGEGEIHAVVSYENGAWFPLVWVGSMVTERLLREKYESAIRQLGHQHKPSGWVIVGFDSLAAKLAADAWAGKNALVTSTDGSIESEMRPGSFGFPLREKAAPVRLGRPENLVNWWRSDSRQYKPAMVALNSPLNYKVFRFIAEWYGPTPAHLETRFGGSYRAAVRALRKAGLVVKLDGGFYLDQQGELAVAQMDRVPYQTVKQRLDGYLKEDGLYRTQQQRHNRSLLDVVNKFNDCGVDAYGGWRVRRTTPDGIQVVPDAAVLWLLDGASDIAFVELEFTAVTPVLRRRKRRTYVAVQRHLQKTITQLWLFADPETAEKYRRTRRESENMGTGVLSDFLKSGWDAFS